MPDPRLDPLFRDRLHVAARSVGVTPQEREYISLLRDADDYIDQLEGIAVTQAQVIAAAIGIKHTPQTTVRALTDHTPILSNAPPRRRWWWRRA